MLGLRSLRTFCREQNIKDRQCTYNVILRRVLATTVALEKQCVLHNLCVFSLWYPACKAHAPYYHLWTAPLYNIFPHYLINRTILRGKKNIIEHKMCVSSFSTNLSETFSILRRIKRIMIKNEYRSSCKSTLYSCLILNKL